MRRTWTIIGVGDVHGSFKWYQSLLGVPGTAPAHDYWGQIIDADGTVLLCLHEWGAHEHPSLTSPDHAQPGNGLLLFFRVDDFDLSLTRARALVAGSRRSPTGIRTPEPWSSHSEIRTAITSRSVRSLRPDNRCRGAGRRLHFQDAHPSIQPRTTRDAAGARRSGAGFLLRRPRPARDP